MIGESMTIMLEKCTKSFFKILLTPLFKLDEMIDPGFNPYDRRGNKKQHTGGQNMGKRFDKWAKKQVFFGNPPP